MREFSSREELAAALAEAVATAMRARLTTGEAALAVSGGTTPEKFFAALSQAALDWGRVTVTLADDRWLPETELRSNARLVRERLLVNAAAAARFLPLVTAQATPEAGLETAQAALQALPLPLAAVVLGLGTDGHTASLFPGGDHLARALAPAPGRLVESMHCEAADEPRITLTLPVLTGAGRVFIHIEGDTKRRVLEAALRPGPVEEMPIRAVLRARPDAEIFWA